jgi:hypothetical protein
LTLNKKIPLVSIIKTEVLKTTERHGNNTQTEKNACNTIYCKKNDILSLSKNNVFIGIICFTILNILLEI